MLVRRGNLWLFIVVVLIGIASRATAMEEALRAQGLQDHAHEIIGDTVLVYEDGQVIEHKLMDGDKLDVGTCVTDYRQVGNWERINPWNWNSSAQDALNKRQAAKRVLYANSTLQEDYQPFSVGNYNEQETFNMLLNILERMPWFKSNGYNVPVPSHPMFKDLEEHPEKIKIFDRDQYFKTFVAEVYKPLNCVPVQKMVANDRYLLLAALDRLRTLNKKWGFKIFPHYKIMLLLYGPGGRYIPDLK